MISFRQFIIEKYTLSDVSGSAHIDEPGLPVLSDDDAKFLGWYIKQVHNWVNSPHGFKGDTAKQFLINPKAKRRIPKHLRKGGTLYRGLLLFDEEEFEYFKKIKGFMPRLAESWTREVDTAMSFAKGDRGTIGIVLKKKFSDSEIVLDIPRFVNDKKIIKQAQAISSDKFSSAVEHLANGEDEVLIAPKSKYTFKDVMTTITYAFRGRTPLEELLKLTWDEAT